LPDPFFFEQLYKKGKDYTSINGLCYIGKSRIKNYIQLPSFEEAVKDNEAFTDMFREFYENNDPFTGQGICQGHGDRFLICNPPAEQLKTSELDRIYNLPYERSIHPYYSRQGKIRAIDTIRFSITSHRGCFGECSFCAIAVHQGRRIISRSESSILKEVKDIVNHRDFRGIINDVGGPTANMYGYNCSKKNGASCRKKRCLFPDKCPGLKGSHKKQIDLLGKILNTDGIKKVFISSGLRYDLIMDDTKFRDEYIRQLAMHHISGQLKVAPEHSEQDVLHLMGKRDIGILVKFKTLFDSIKKEINSRQFLTYYFIAAHPGSTMEHARALKKFINKELRISPEQVQIFTPSPSTFSTLMYYTGVDPFTGRKIFVERNRDNKEKQKRKIIGRREK